MAKKKEGIDINSIKANPQDTVEIRGKLSFSRLAKFIEGKELEERNQRGFNGKPLTFPKTRPYATVTLKNVRIVAKDPANPTLFERYIAEKCYTSDTYPENKKMFSMDAVANDTKSNLPPVLKRIRNTDGSESLQVVNLEKELAQDLDVSLFVNIFKSRTYKRNGLGLAMVVLNEPLRYFGTNSVEAMAKARGFNFIPADPEDVKENEDVSSFSEDEYEDRAADVPDFPETDNEDDVFSSPGDGVTGDIEEEDEEDDDDMGIFYSTEDAD